MTIVLAIVAAVIAVAVIVLMLRLVPGRTERVPANTQRSGGQGEELSPSDRPA
jgi:hypothetical protein